ASIHIGKAHLRGCAGHHHRGAEGLEGRHGGIPGDIVGNQETEVVKADIVGPPGESVQVSRWTCCLPLGAQPPLSLCKMASDPSLDRLPGAAIKARTCSWPQVRTCGVRPPAQ